MAPVAAAGVGAVAPGAATSGSRCCACWPRSRPTATSSCRRSRSAAAGAGARARDRSIPTIAQLEDEGLVRSIESEGSRQLEITDAGRAHLETRAGEPDPWAADDEAGEDALTELGPIIIGLGKAAWQVASVGTPAQRAQALELLAETQRGLYRILAEEPEAGDGDAGDDEGTGGAQSGSATD